MQHQKSLKAQAKYLFSEDQLEYHIDILTDEVNCTTLAEDAATEFDLFEPVTMCPQEWLFEMAFEISDASVY